MAGWCGDILRLAHETYGHDQAAPLMEDALRFVARHAGSGPLRDKVTASCRDLAPPPTTMTLSSAAMEDMRNTPKRQHYYIFSNSRSNSHFYFPVPKP